MNELSPLKDKWDCLLEASETNIIFSTFEWVSSWWESFGADKNLFVLIVEKDDVIVGIAPLMITSHKKFRVRIRKLEFIGTPLSNYSDFIISQEKEEVLKVIYGYILKKRGCWDIINLKEIPETSSTVSISQRILDKHRVFSNFFVSDLCRFLVLESSNRRMIEKKIKQKTLRRHINYFNRTGRLSFVRYDRMENFDEADDLMEKFFEQHISRWESTSTPSMFYDPRHRTFYHSILKSMLPKKWVTFSTLKFDDKVIAFLFGFSYDNTYSEYIVSFDINYAKRSPGMIAFKYNIEDTLNRGVSEYDLGRGNTPYKSRFTDRVRKNFKIGVYQNYFIYILDTAWEKTKEGIMKHGSLFQRLFGFKNQVDKFYTNLFHTG
ncbi:MAG: GNAT family N-acetyltransferase [Candidatus Altiarchaeota archaeon]|nr:GNAT family N-acetyltransferase [Candidatus Altiarchaeota archaeon]